MTKSTQNPESIVQLAAALTAAWNSHDPQQVAALCADDYEGENIGEAQPHRGPEGMAASVSAYLAAFPDIDFTIDEVVIEGDRIVQIWRAQATHLGPLMNIPASGRHIEVRGASRLTFKDHKLYRALYIWDVAGLLRDIGLLPDL